MFNDLDWNLTLRLKHAYDMDEYKNFVDVFNMAVRHLVANKPFVSRTNSDVTPAAGAPFLYRSEEIGSIHRALLSKEISSGAAELLLMSLKPSLSEENRKFTESTYTKIRSRYDF